MNSIYTYLSYRKFLADFYHCKKLNQVEYTHALFCKKARLNSPNYLKLVMDKKRNLTVPNIHRFAFALELKGAEVEFFEALVLFEQSILSAEKLYYRQRLSEIKAKGSQNLVRIRSSSLIDNSLMTAVLLCASGKLADEVSKTVSEELLIDILEAEKIIFDLRKRGFLIATTNGRMKAKNTHEMIHDPQGIKLNQKQFIEDGLLEATRTCKERFSGSAKFLSLLMTAPSGSLKELFSRFQVLAEKTTEDFNPENDEPAGVYRLQFQIYRLKRNEL
jgi:uncharacterized protein (TIGR02147 family)